MSVLVLTEAELREHVPMDLASLAEVENAFTWLASGKVSMPPIMHVEVDHQSDVDIKSAYVRGQDAFAVKMASGFFGNTDLGLPSASGMVVLLSAQTGFCQAVFLDNGYLTDLRTGLAGAVAAKHLAKQSISTVGVIGTGGQARYQVESLSLIRSFERLLVAGRSDGNTQRYVEDMRRRLSVDVQVADSIESLVRESEVIVTTTPSKSPLIEAGWVQPGTHITAMGADLPGKQEVDASLWEAADVAVCDSIAQCAIGGELQHRPGDKGRGVIELGQITAGTLPGRGTDEQITLCDLTGTGVQDTAIGLAAFRSVQAAGAGVAIG